MAVLVASLLVILGDGCAWRSADAAPPNARDLAGDWHGDIVQPGGSLYTVEARAVLEINADGTFTATVTPSNGGGEGETLSRLHPLRRVHPLQLGRAAAVSPDEEEHVLAALLGPGDPAR